MTYKRVYLYQCESCGTHFDLRLTTGSNPSRWSTCPRCNSDNAELSNTAPTEPPPHHKAHRHNLRRVVGMQYVDGATFLHGFYNTGNPTSLDESVWVCTSCEAIYCWPEVSQFLMDPGHDTRISMRP